jgi:hypothetical protein
MLRLVVIIIPFLTIVIICRWYLAGVHSSLYWCWDNRNDEKRVVIDTDAVSFPEKFLWGTAAASYQCEGPGDKAPITSNWSEWELAGIKRGQRCGITVDHITIDIKKIFN